MHIPFNNTYARLPSEFYAHQSPVPVQAPQLIRFNLALATNLGVAAGTPEEMARIFAGNAVPEGAEPLAQAYAGHQFGGFSPQLGDGRAVLLGEVVDQAGQRRDIQLKGSGPTPFSRNGDGRAWLGPVLREYVVSEAMHALGVPTTRALAATLTGELVYRQQGGLPGAVLTRAASSHIRVGTFQYFAARRNIEGLRTLYEYTRARHYPEVETPGAFLRAVIARQAQLIAQWMAVGFIHGVMNTDNTAVSGETIDYGPCAFMDVYHPVTVFSSIDRQGRYAYDNQREVIVWNMAQLASALIPMMPDEDAAIADFTQAVHAMPDQIDAAWLVSFAPKIGLTHPTESDRALITDLLILMQDGHADFTNTFRALGTGVARDHFADPTAFDIWEARWRMRLTDEDGWQRRMQDANPAYIPRNHRIEQMIEAAVAGDFAPFERLLRVLADPYADQTSEEDLQHPPAPAEVVRQTFCGT